MCIHTYVPKLLSRMMKGEECLVVSWTAELVLIKPVFIERFQRCKRNERMYVHTTKNKSKTHDCAVIQQGVLAIACSLSLKGKHEIAIIIIISKVADLMGHFDEPLPNC